MKNSPMQIGLHVEKAEGDSAIIAHNLINRITGNLRYNHQVKAVRLFAPIGSSGIAASFSLTKDEDNAYLVYIATKLYKEDDLVGVLPKRKIIIDGLIATGRMEYADEVAEDILKFMEGIGVAPLPQENKVRPISVYFTSASDKVRLTDYALSRKDKRQIFEFYSLEEGYRISWPSRTNLDTFSAAQLLVSSRDIGYGHIIIDSVYQEPTRTIRSDSSVPAVEDNKFFESIMEILDSLPEGAEPEK